MLRRRLRAEWWATALTVGTIVATMTLFIWPGPLGESRSTAVLAAGGVVLLAIAVGALVAVCRFPVPPPPVVPGRRSRDIAAAAAEARRGRSVEPAVLRSAAIDLERRNLRTVPLGLIGMAMGGINLSGTLESNGFPVLAAILAAVFVVAAGAVLGYLRCVQHRLDRLENTGAAAPAAPG